ncbi:MarR family winged helix-turn-helix transcriptional regulator [Sphingobium scionense]|uniref:DNA-binding MarR family transcriptional regulator n=2 Tax=Sphingobium scionense TaxID=1404341 RepID=A0A7W6PY89_9SPHN|nr:DNA-binding MarR family transcriptional regulator [Sphingobium scionense]
MKKALASRTEAVDPTSSALGVLAQDPAMALRLAEITVFRDLAIAFRPFGLSPPEFAALKIIAENPALRMGELADLMMIRQPNLLAFISGLQKNGLIDRSRDSVDKRSFRLTLTAEGKVLLERADMAQTAYRERMAQHLGQDNLEQLTHLLMQLVSLRPLHPEFQP